MHATRATVHTGRGRQGAADHRTGYVGDRGVRGSQFPLQSRPRIAPPERSPPLGRRGGCTRSRGAVSDCGPSLRGRRAVVQLGTTCCHYEVCRSPAEVVPGGGSSVSQAPIRSAPIGLRPGGEALGPVVAHAASAGLLFVRSPASVEAGAEAGPRTPSKRCRRPLGRGSIEARAGLGDGKTPSRRQGTAPGFCKPGAVRLSCGGATAT